MVANYQTPHLYCVSLPAITPIYVPVVTVYILLKLYIAIKYIPYLPTLKPTSYTCRSSNIQQVVQQNE